MLLKKCWWLMQVYVTLFKKSYVLVINIVHKIPLGLQCCHTGSENRSIFIVFPGLVLPVDMCTFPMHCSGFLYRVARISNGNFCWIELRRRLFSILGLKFSADFGDCQKFLFWNHYNHIYIINFIIYKTKIRFQTDLKKNLAPILRIKFWYRIAKILITFV